MTSVERSGGKPNQTPRVRSIGGGDASATSITTPVREEIGRGASTGRVRTMTTFPDVLARADRLIAWAAEETEFLATRDVRRFSPEDIAGRDHFAYEALYELVPRLRLDLAVLRGACGPGELTDQARARCRLASLQVQAYVLAWETRRDDAARER